MFLGKQCRPWSDAAFYGVWYGSVLFANVPVKVLQIALDTSLWRHSDKNSAAINNRYQDYVRMRDWMSLVNDLPPTKQFINSSGQPRILRKIWRLYTMARLWTIDPKSADLNGKNINEGAQEMPHSRNAALRKHAYSNILKILPHKVKENFLINMVAYFCHEIAR